MQAGASPLPSADSLPGNLILGAKVHVASQSDLYQGTWLNDGQERVVCVKCLRNTAPEKDPNCPNLSRDERFLIRLERETSIWTRAKHDNILPFHGYQIRNETPMLVSPWMKNGSLDKYLALHPETTDIVKLNLLRDAAQGLAYLHGLDPPIAHGDLKPENILITDYFRAVLCDLGVSRIMLEGRTGLTTASSAPGSLGFQARELIMGDSLPTVMSDMYAMGSLILDTMSGEKPFHNARTQGKVIVLIANHQTCAPEDHPRLPANDRLWDFLRECWDPEPENRPNVDEALDELDQAIQQRQPEYKIQDGV